MGHIIGRGRYARATYPISSGVGGGNPSVSQDAWFIDGQDVSGLANDANDGKTRLTPIVHHLVYRDRIALGPLNQDTTVTFMSDTQSDDIVDLGYATNGHEITYDGDTTIARADDTIAAYTNRAPGSNTPNLLTSTGAINWDDFVGNGFIVRFTTGDATGFAAYVCKNVGVNQCRLSTVWDATSFTEVQPAPGDHFVIERMPAIANASLGGMIGNLDGVFNISRLNFLPDEFGAVAVGPLTIVTSFIECAFTFLFSTNPFSTALYNNCQMMVAPTIQGGLNTFLAGAILDTVGELFIAGSSPGTFGNGLILQGAAMLTSFDGQSGSFDDVGFFDVGAQPTTAMSRGSSFQLGTVWGAATAGQFACVLDRTSNLRLHGTGQTLQSGDVAHQVSLPNAGAVTWAAARVGIKDGATSNATTMPA